MSTINELKLSIPAWAWLILSLILIGVFLLRLHLLPLFLERDEGEYAYMAQLMLKGIPPYAQAYSMKLPGIYAAYAIVLAIFGQTPTGIHLGLMAVNMITVVLIFLIARRLTDLPMALAASACFAVLSASPAIHGVIANAEHFVLLAALAGILVLLIAIETDKLLHFFGSGLLLGLSFLMKQHGAAFIAFACSYLCIKGIYKQPLRFRSTLIKILLVLAGVLIPFGVTCLILLMAGVFDKFWFWTFTYAREYISIFTFSETLPMLKEKTASFVLPAFFILLIAAVGLGAIFFTKKGRAQFVFMGLFLVFSILSVTPGCKFDNHYFMFLIPGLSFLFGLAIQALTDAMPDIKVKKYLPVGIVLLSLSHSVYIQRDLLFRADMISVSRLLYGENPFPEAQTIAKYIREHSNNSDRIAILGSEPEILFYADRTSATGYIYMYPLMERQPYASLMRTEAIAEIESSQPEFFVFVGLIRSWAQELDYDRAILNWAKEYSNKYERVGLIDILLASRTEYYWDQAAADIRPKSAHRIFVYRKKT